MGIPCIYYGTEQQFDGHGDNDRFIREAMFGGEFGAFESRGRHFFDETGTVYRELQKILRLRREHLVIRRGRQFLRQISGDGQNFGLPVMIGGTIRSVVPWSRIFSDREVLLAVNTDVDVPQDRVGHDRQRATCTRQPAHVSATPRTPLRSAVRWTVEPRNGKAVQLAVPAAGFVAFA